MKAIRKPPLQAERGPNRTRLIAFALVVAAICAGFSWALTLPHHVIGDGREYICTAASWVDLGKPFSTAPYFVSCAQHLNPWDPQPLNGYFIWEDTREAAHFWFLSLLAAPFVSLVRALDMQTVQSFTLLHACLAVLTSARILWRLNLPRAPSLS